MLFGQILIDGFAISSLYAFARERFHADFSASPACSLRAARSWSPRRSPRGAALGNLGAGAYPAAGFGIIVALLLALATYYLIVRRLQLSRAVCEEEKEIFILTATLLWGIMIQEGIAYFYTNNAKTVLPIVDGVGCARPQTRFSPHSSAGRRSALSGFSPPMSGAISRRSPPMSFRRPIAPSRHCYCRRGDVCAPARIDGQR
jgi:hypothetical protein